jgi:hypothetical protein
MAGTPAGGVQAGAILQATGGTHINIGMLRLYDRGRRMRKGNVNTTPAFVHIRSKRREGEGAVVNHMMHSIRAGRRDGGWRWRVERKERGG